MRLTRDSLLRAKAAALLCHAKDRGCSRAATSTATWKDQAAIPIYGREDQNRE